MNHIYRLVMNRALGILVPVTEFRSSRRKGRNVGTKVGAAAIALLTVLPASAAAFLDFSGGLGGWTTTGDATLLNSVDSFSLGGNAFSLGPASGESMVRLTPMGATGVPNAMLGLSSNALNNFLGSSITNFGAMSNSFTFGVGNYSFAWAYAAEDYQPFNDGVLFSVVGGGAAETIVSLARNGSDPTDLSGPSPGTLILGSYGSTAWNIASFNITVAGNYQLGFASYNWDDTGLDPHLYIAAVAGSFTGTPPPVSGGGGGSTVIGGTGGNVSASVFDTTSAAYAAPSLTFDGGTLQYVADTTTSKPTTLEVGGGGIDTNGFDVQYTDVIDGVGALTKLGAGTLVLTEVNTYTGGTEIAAGTLALVGSGSIAASSGVANDGILDISGTTSGASLASLTGGGSVALGTKTLTLTDATGAFAGSVGGSGGLAVSGGNLVLTGTSTYTGGTEIAAGTLALVGSGSIAASSGVANDGILDISGTTAGASLASLTGGGSVALGTKTLTLTDAAGAFAGSVGGSGGLAVSGGNLVLTGISTYTGGTTISNGAGVTVASDSALGATEGALIMDGGTYATTASFSSARAVQMEADGTFDIAAGTTLTHSGTIAGGGALVKDGAGRLVLSGDNASWGTANDPSSQGLVISGGVVQLASAGALGNGALVIDGGELQSDVSTTIAEAVTLGNARITTAAQTVMTLAGPVQTGGAGSCFEKTGAGTLLLSGTATLGNGTCVIGGSLYANGHLNSTVTVQSEGILRGTGSITGPVNVQGRLAPGNSPGTLVVASTVTMNAGSTLQVDINGTGTGTGPGNYSRLVVTGGSSQFIAGGATLNPNLQVTGSGTYVPYVPAVGDSFRIVTAEGGIVGTFDSLLQPNGLAPATRMALFYGGNAIDVRVLPGSYAALYRAAGRNANIVSAGTAMDEIVLAGTSARSNFAAAFSGFDEAELNVFGADLAGEIHGAMAAAAPQSTRWTIEAVARQQNAAAAADPAVDDERPVLWADVGHQQSRWLADSQASAFRAERLQVIAGADMPQAGPVKFGFGFSHSKADIDAANGTGSVTDNQGFVYGRATAGALRLDALAGIGYANWASERVDPLDSSARLKGATGGTTAMISAGIGLPMSLSALSLQPYTRAAWQKSSHHDFTETGSSDAALTVAGKSVSGASLTMGVAGGSAGQNPLAAPLTWQFDFAVLVSDRDLIRPQVGATLLDAPMVIGSPNVSRFALSGGVAATARLSARGYAYLGVTTESRDGKADDYGFNAGVRFTLD